MNPHCSHCLEQVEIERELLREQNRCNSCESLQMQLAELRQHNKELLERLLNPNGNVAPIVNTENLKPIQRGRTPFHLIRKTLEQESRAKAAAMQNAAQPDKVVNSETTNAVESSDSVNAELKEPAEDVKPLEDLIFNAKVDRETQVGTKQA